MSASDRSPRRASLRRIDAGVERLCARSEDDGVRRWLQKNGRQMTLQALDIVAADEVAQKLRDHTPDLVAALKRAARQGSKAARRLLIERADLVKNHV